MREAFSVLVAVLFGVLSCAIIIPWWKYGAEPFLLCRLPAILIPSCVLTALWMTVVVYACLTDKQDRQVAIFHYFPPFDTILNYYMIILRLILHRAAPLRGRPLQIRIAGRRVKIFIFIAVCVMIIVSSAFSVLARISMSYWYNQHCLDLI